MARPCSLAAQGARRKIDDVRISVGVYTGARER
jgi:hypothetical protein